jgi:hypothetical protein
LRGHCPEFRVFIVERREGDLIEDSLAKYEGLKVNEIPSDSLEWLTIQD